MIHKKNNNIFKINNNFINLSKLNIYYYNRKINDFSEIIYDTFSLKINIKNKDKINNYINKTNENLLLYNINDIYNKYNSKKEKFYYKIKNTKKYFSIF